LRDAACIIVWTAAEISATACFVVSLFAVMNAVSGNLLTEVNNFAR
jgi:hypothetical protein